MALINLLAAFLATWLPQHVLPDNARTLWRQADRLRLVEARRAAGEDQRIARSDNGLGLLFRRDTIQSLSATERLVKEFGDSIERHQGSSDPTVQETVKEFRGHKKNLEGDLEWYRQLLVGGNGHSR